MRKFVAVLFSCALLATSLITLSSSSASAETTLITCADSVKNKTIVLKEDKENCRPFQGAAIWRVEQSDTSINSGDASATLKICSSQNPLFSYKFIKSKCPKFQITTDYRRAVVKPQTPFVISTAANGHSEAALLLATDTSTVRNHAPIAYYLITNLKSNEITKVAPDVLNRLFISGLNPLTTYTFQIAAVNIDGTSPLSLITPEIRTTAVPVAPPAPATAPAVAAPAFTISSASESKPVNSAITGYTITSSGGAIASYSISPAAPAGLTFSTSTGLLSGTPTSVASATSYTITATNATGSATRTFTLTVTLAVYTVGQTGPGGGKIFYVASGFFTQVGASGSMCTTNCKYLEVAPDTWSGGSSDPAISWSTGSNQTAEATGADGTAIGDGYMNSLDIVAQAGNLAASSTAVAARGYTPTVSTITFNDWFLPSKDELNELYLQKSTVGMPSVGIYWSSSESGASTASIQGFDNGFQYSPFNKNLARYARPVRAFGP